MAVVVNVDRDRADGRRPSLERLNALVAGDLEAVNRVILEHMQSPVALIPQLAGYIVAAGGKRLRPMLTLAAAKLCGYSGRQHVNLAASVEFIHTATLLHDDVVDNSGLRRGNATANAVWGNKPSVLVGDFLFSRSFQLMVASGSLPVLKVLSDAAAVIAEGEVMQLITSHDTDTGEAAYLDVIQAKTATLFAAACRLGAVVAERPPGEEEALERYGMNLGMAFQLIDDVLDYSARQAELGKTIGDDFSDGKITLPVVLAYQRANVDERAFWHRTLENGEQREADLHRAIALLYRHGALGDTIERARHYGALARDALGVFPDSAERAILHEVVDFCIDRVY